MGIETLASTFAISSFSLFFFRVKQERRRRGKEQHKSRVLRRTRNNLTGADLIEKEGSSDNVSTESCSSRLPAWRVSPTGRKRNGEDEHHLFAGVLPQQVTESHESTPGTESHLYSFTAAVTKIHNLDTHKPEAPA